MKSPVRKLIKPPALSPGDLVGMVAPAGPAERASTARGIAWLEQAGLRVKPGRHLFSRRGYLAGGDRERAADLMAMFTDPDVRAVFCLRGGYGSPRILPLLDYQTIAANPKILLGYSDITALLLSIHQRTGLVTFHGPMVAADFGRDPDGYTVDAWRRALFHPEPLGRVEHPAGMGTVTVRSGRASGRLVGGNLSLLACTMGTPYEVETRGGILFLEEVGEAVYRLDRLLWQLGQAGKLEGIAGLVFGECHRCGAAGEGGDNPVPALLADVLSDLNVPILSGPAIGHGKRKATLPIGVRAALDADAGSLIIEEPATLPA